MVKMFTKHGHFTADAREATHDMLTRIDPIVQKLLNKGYNRAEIIYMIVSQLDLKLCQKVVMEHVHREDKNPFKEKDKAAKTIAKIKAKKKKREEHFYHD